MNGEHSLNLCWTDAHNNSCIRSGSGLNDFDCFQRDFDSCIETYAINYDSTGAFCSSPGFFDSWPTFDSLVNPIEEMKECQDSFKKTFGFEPTPGKYRTGYVNETYAKHNLCNWQVTSQVVYGIQIKEIDFERFELYTTWEGAPYNSGYPKSPFTKTFRWFEGNNTLVLTPDCLVKDVYFLKNEDIVDIYHDEKWWPNARIIKLKH